jgi:hypothetical protein
VAARQYASVRSQSAAVESRKAVAHVIMRRP